MTPNHRNRDHAGANDGGRSDLPALAIDALPGIWSTWMQFGFDITQEEADWLLQLVQQRFPHIVRERA